jgi:integrase/recombinase XerD
MPHYTFQSSRVRRNVMGMRLLICPLLYPFYPSEDRIFPISYESARVMVAKAGKMVGVPLRPHDLRRYAATFASRSGVPIEIVSKVILRHSNLSTTQRYLGKITDTEVMKWIENLYG